MRILPPLTNLGSIHSFLAAEGNFQTTKFDLHLKLDYNQITVSNKTLRKFVLTSINDISSVAQCNKDFIRVFSISRVSSVLVGFGITTPQFDETKIESKIDNTTSGYLSIHVSRTLRL